MVACAIGMVFDKISSVLSLGEKAISLLNVCSVSAEFSSTSVALTRYTRSLCIVSDGETGTLVTFKKKKANFISNA